MQNIDGLTKIHLSELPEACFINHAAKLINGHIWFREIDRDALTRIKIAFHGHFDPSLLENVELIFKSVPANVTICISASGQKVFFGEGCHGAWVFRLFGPNTLAQVGDQSTSNGVEVFINENGKLVVGRDCMFASGITIHVGDNHAIFDMVSGEVLNFRDNPYVVIRNHVWVGQHATITGDCTIETGAVLATRSICLIDVPACSLLAGNPGKIKKNNVSWARSYRGQDSINVMQMLKKDIGFADEIDV